MLIATLIARHDWVKMMVLSKTIGDLLRLDNFCKSSWTTLEEDAFKKEEFENKFKVDVVVYPN